MPPNKILYPTSPNAGSGLSINSGVQTFAPATLASSVVTPTAAAVQQPALSSNPLPQIQDLPPPPAHNYPSKESHSKLLLILGFFLIPILLGALLAVTTEKNRNLEKKLQGVTDSLSAVTKDVAELAGLRDVTTPEKANTSQPDPTPAPSTDNPATTSSTVGPQGPAGPKGTNGSNGSPGATGSQGPAGPSGIASCPSGDCLSLQPSTPGVVEVGNINVSGTAVANSFTGNGSALSNVDAATLQGNNSAYFTDASNLSSGTLADGRLSTNVTLQGNTFNGINQLVRLDGSGNLPALNASALTNLNASNISFGTLADVRLSTNVTLQGNSFNGASQLVQLTGGGLLPVLNGSNLTNLDAATLGGNNAAYYTNASNISSGTLNDLRLSGNVSLLGISIDSTEITNDSITDADINSAAAISWSKLSKTGSSLADLTTRSATDLSSGTLADGRLTTNVTLQGNTFNGISQLVQLTGGGILPILSGANLTNIDAISLQGNGSSYFTNASNIGSGTLNNSRLSSSVTLQGNSFNGISQLVQLDGSGNLPPLNASALTNFNGSNISSGSVSDLRLSGNVTLSGNVFNGVSQLVKLDGSGNLPALNGSALTNLTATNISTGTLNDTRLSSNVTLAGNSFNGINQLVKLDGAGKLPVLDGSAVTNVDALTLSGNSSSYFTNASNLSSGTVNDARLSSNVALLNGTGPQTFTGNNKFTGTVLAQNSANSTAAFQVQNAGGTNLINVNTTNGYVINNGTTTPGNALENPGFEAFGTSGLAGWQTPNGAVLTNDAANSRTGNNVVVIPAAAAYTYATTTKLYAVTAGDQFDIQVWAKNTAGTDGLGYLGYTFYDKDKVGTFTILQTFSPPGTSYALKKFTYTIPAGANYHYIAMTVGHNDTSTTGTWYFDDAYMTNTSYRSPAKFQNSTDSTTAFQIQNVAGTSNLLIADTTNTRIGIGANPANSLLTIGTNTTTAAGGITFGTDTSLYRSASDTLKTDDNLVVQTVANSVAAFQVQNAAGTALFTADTTNGYVINNGITTPGLELVNPSFEADASGWSIANSSINASSTNAHTGNKSVQTSSISASVGPQKRFGVTEGAVYESRYWAKTSAGATLTTTAGIAWYNKDLGLISLSLFGGIETPTTSFVNYGGRLTAPAGAAYANVVYGLQSYTSGTVYFDDMYFGSSTQQGSRLFQNFTDSTTAFQIQNAAGTSNLFIADTTNSRVGIGTTPASSLLTIGTNTTTVAGGIYFGTDTNLYRSSSQSLKSDGTIIAAGDFQAYEWIQSKKTTAAQITLGESGALLPTIFFGSANDTNLYRSAANTLKTDDNFFIQTTTNSTTAFQIQNAAGTSNLLIADTTNSRIGIGATPANSLLTIGTNTTTAAGGITFGTDTSLYRSGTDTLKTDDMLHVGGQVSNEIARFQGRTDASDNRSFVSLYNTNPGYWWEFSVQDAAGGALQNGFAIRDRNGAGASAERIYIDPGGGWLRMMNSGLLFGPAGAAPNASTIDTNLYRSGAAQLATDSTFRIRSNSTAAFQIQNSAGTTDLLTVDAGGSTITLGSASATPVLLVLGNKNTSGDPSCTNGAIYYNSNTSQFRGCANSSWTSLGENKASARAYHSTNQAISSGTETTLSLNSENFDTDNIHDNVTNNSRLTCKTAGKYQIFGQIAFSVNATGLRYLVVMVNGSTRIVNETQNAVTSAGDVTAISASTIWDCAVNDYFELKAYQNSGSSVDVINSGSQSPVLGITRLSD